MTPDGLGTAFIDAIADAVVTRVADRLPDPSPTQREAATDGRLAVSVAEAAELIGCSEEHFRRHVLHELRIVRSGRLRLVPVTELEAWLDRSAARVLG